MPPLPSFSHGNVLQNYSQYHKEDTEDMDSDTFKMWGISSQGVSAVALLWPCLHPSVHYSPAFPLGNR